MNQRDWVAFLEERISNREKNCEYYGWDLVDTDLVATFIGPSAKGLGVRPLILETREHDKVYGLTLKQARKALKVAKSAG